MASYSIINHLRCRNVSSSIRVRMLSKTELEYIRPWVSMRLTAVLGGYNPTVIDAALECIAKSLNRQSTTGMECYSN